MYADVELILDKALKIQNQNISNYIAKKINEALSQFKIDTKHLNEF